MSKTLITTIGLLVSIGVVALGLFLVALPLYVQSLGVDGQTASVQSTNALYQAQIDGLREQEENLDAINRSVADLRSEIPETGQLDDVFEVIGRAAESSQVTITSISAGVQAPFAVRTGAGVVGAPEPLPEPDATTDPESGDPDADAGAGDGTAVVPPPTTGRQQVDFSIQVTVSDMDQVTTFLDAMRAGPRLLSSVTAEAIQASDGGITVTITAMTYLDSRG